MTRDPRSTNGGPGGTGPRARPGGSANGQGITGGRVRREPADLLPLTEPVFHILLALAERDQHGYGIILTVEETTAGKVRLRTGTLYTAVRRLVEEGLIEETTPSGGEAEGSRRRVYRLTAFGRSVARAEARRVAKLASLARTRGLLARGSRPRF